MHLFPTVAAEVRPVVAKSEWAQACGHAKPAHRPTVGPDISTKVRSERRVPKRGRPPLLARGGESAQTTLGSIQSVQLHVSTSAVLRRLGFLLHLLARIPL